MIEEPFYTASMEQIFRMLSGYGWEYSPAVFNTAFSCIFVGLVIGAAVWLLAKAISFIFSLMKGA